MIYRPICKVCWTKSHHFLLRYLNCVSEYMKDLKPFGDVPDKLSVQVKRSFVATRTFVQALSAAADVAKNMISVRPLVECTAALTKMSTCGACMGYSEKPCEQFCVDVMKTCLQQYVELDAEWDLFVAQMEKVSDRLLGPFNIVMVVEPINIKISEAIMNFQVSFLNAPLSVEYLTMHSFILRNLDMTSANEFLWAAVSQSWDDRGGLIRLSTRTLIFSLTTSKTTRRSNERNELPIQSTKRPIAVTTKKSKLNHSSSHATSSSREIVATATEVGTRTETATSDTRTAEAKPTIAASRDSTSSWRRSDRKSKTRRSSGPIFLTPLATTTTLHQPATATTVGMDKQSTGKSTWIKL